MYYFIKDPITKINYPIFNDNGKKILDMYYKLYKLIYPKKLCLK